MMFLQSFNKEKKPPKCLPLMMGVEGENLKIAWLSSLQTTTILSPAFAFGELVDNNTFFDKLKKQRGSAQAEPLCFLSVVVLLEKTADLVFETINDVAILDLILDIFKDIAVFFLVLLILVLVAAELILYGINDSCEGKLIHITEESLDSTLRILLELLEKLGSVLNFGNCFFDKFFNVIHCDFSFLKIFISS